MNTEKDTHELVRKAYGSVARRQQSCCGPAPVCCGPSQAAADNRGSNAVDRVGGLPVPESELGLSCGNPVAFAHLDEGDVALDLGSGAGKDVFLAAEKVGPTGRAIGVDMTPEMIALANQNAEKFRQRTGLDNVEFRHGQIESLPVDDACVDVVISNCVINLSPDKPAVFREVFRVLRAGGKMIVSDIVLNRELPETLRNDEQLYAACIAGAALKEDYLRAVREAGFESVEVLSEQTYSPEQSCCNPITAEAGEDLAGVASSVTVLATKAGG